VLATANGEAARRLVDDPGRAMTQPGVTERAVVRDEAARDVTRDGTDEPADDLDAQSGRPADQCLGALPRDDSGYFAPLVGS
jgi:hypothetical protein